MLTNCQVEFFSLPETCRNCLQVYATLNDVQTIISICTMPGTSNFVFGGHNGLIMASKKKIRNKDFFQFEDYLTQSAFLYGEVEGA